MADRSWLIFRSEIHSWSMYLKITYLWLHWVFVSALGLPLVVVHRLLIEATSLVVEHGPQAHRFQ